MHQGYFPDSAAGNEDARRSRSSSIDADLYAPVLSGLEWFYPRSGARRLHPRARLQQRRVRRRQAGGAGVPGPRRRRRSRRCPTGAARRSSRARADSRSHADRDDLLRARVSPAASSASWWRARTSSRPTGTRCTSSPRAGRRASSRPRCVRHHVSARPAARRAARLPVPPSRHRRARRRRDLRRPRRLHAPCRRSAACSGSRACTASPTTPRARGTSRRRARRLTALNPTQRVVAGVRAPGVLARRLRASDRGRRRRQG